MRFLCTEELRVDMNNTTIESVTPEKQQCDLLSIVEQFYVAVNNINALQPPCKTPDILVRF
jgi:hypothetical protein